MFGNFALELGDTHRKLALAAHNFFVTWQKVLLGLFQEATERGQLKKDTDYDGLSALIMSGIEGGILISKASKDKEAILKTIGALKAVIEGCTT
ncbi:MAG: TetR family transcriptional regulator C-terminal domain-containing protein [Desulfatiglans sp.]|nr:TetR family transcriptional regulator C-terminal domain-containing protein [Thermodesulfobacteriota bacterium]MEE4352444.1 TetR family transcriptional regulator C-terminal domain-containing protein [Desulfatiglans sp.]